MMQTPINITAKFALFTEQWEPKIIARMNDTHFKLARVEGEFIWHRHDDTDEVFIVIEGELTIHLRDGDIRLRQGEMFVVPKGVEHKPSAKTECQIMVVEPAGVVNTGDAGGDRTAPNDVWI